MTLKILLKLVQKLEKPDIEILNIISLICKVFLKYFIIVSEINVSVI